MKHVWTTPQSTPADIGTFGHRVCETCGAEQWKRDNQLWGRVTGYSWDPLVGRCRQPGLTPAQRFAFDSPCVIPLVRLAFVPASNFALGLGREPHDLPWLAPTPIGAAVGLQAFWAESARGRGFPVRVDPEAKEPERGVVLLRQIRVRGSPNLVSPQTAESGLISTFYVHPIAIHPNLVMADVLLHPDDPPVNFGVLVSMSFR